MASPLLLAGWLAALAAGAGAAGADGAAVSRGRRGLSRFSLAELQALTPDTRTRLRRVLRAEGAVLLTDIPGYSATASEALDAVGDCFRHLEATVSRPEEIAAGASRPVASPALLRGGVERWTMATSTRAGAPGPLPDWAVRECPALGGSAERLRSFVSLLLLHFAHSADTAAASGSLAPEAASEATPARKVSSSPARLEPAGAQLPGTALEELVRRGTLLEHFHRYRRGPEQGSAANSRRPLSMHTDAGLLQALAVRWRSTPGSPAAERAAVGLEVELPGGLVVAAEEEVASGPRAREGGEQAGGLLLLLGQASQEWLPHLRLRAAPHALAAAAPSPHETGAGAGSLADRLVYGVMVLPPDDWPLVAPGAGNATFGEWWHRAQLAVGGGSERQVRIAEEVDVDGSQGCLSAGLLQRQLQDAAQTCPAGSIYCWMQCQAVPSDLKCKAERAICMSSTTGKICPEDGSHDASCKPACPAGGSFSFEVLGAGEREVNGGYRSNGWAGSRRSYVKPPSQGALRAEIAWDDYWASDTFGQWVLFVPGYKNGAALYYVDSMDESPPKSGWHAAAGAVPVPTIDFNHSGHDTPILPGEGFCNGVLTDMHMLGFTFTGEETPCLVYLFQGWHLTDSVRFWGAWIVTVLAGIFAEWLVAVRRWEATWRPVPKAAVGRFSPRRIVRQAGRLMLYALTRTMGYIVMLFAMTYSAELFIAVLIGLTIGYACFNLTSPPGEDISLCCQAGSQGGRRQLQASASLVDGQADNGSLVLRFEVKGMTCDACCGTVRRAVGTLDCVRCVMGLSLATGLLEVCLTAADGDIAAATLEHDADMIKTAVEDVGFQAKLLGPLERGIGDAGAGASSGLPGTARGNPGSEAASGSAMATPLILGR
uniref:HMA domain-containing protein n=1 Tax=Alexandrium monilatum TaxID=311494 RepID=A0A7S4QLB2_9DINO